MNTNLNQNSKEVKIHNVVNLDEIKKDKLSLNVVDMFFTQTEKGLQFEPVKLSNYMEMNYDWYGDGNFLYRYKDGVYIKAGKEHFKKEVQRILGDLSRKTKVEETLYHLMNEVTLEDSNIVNPNDGYINIKNGLLNVRTGELIEHDPERLSTIQLPIEYKPDIDESFVFNFVKSVVPEDCVDTIFEMIGYCLLPHTKYQKAFMFTGSGSNGKSVMIDMIMALLGEISITNIPLQDLETNRFKLAQIHGKLLNTFADIPHTALDKSSIFKTIVSGDRVSAEFKGKDSFDFKPFAKLIFSANEIPNSKDVTEGFFRRWIIIPFPNQFTKENRDPHLTDKLTTPESLSALLNLAIKGAQRLYKNNGFDEPETSKIMVNEYKRDSDTVLSFVDEECDIIEGVTIYIKELYNKYKEWCTENGVQSLGKKHFNKRLEAKLNITRGRKHGSSEHWNGIKLK